MTIAPRGVCVVFRVLRLASKPSPKVVKKILSVAGLTILAFARYVFVAPSTAEAMPSIVEALPCTTNTLEFYTLLTAGCTIGEKTFSGFDKSTSDFKLSDINVKPVGVSTSNPGLEFSSDKWKNTNTGGAADIHYHVQVSPSGQPIGGTNVSLSNPQINGFSEVFLEKAVSGDSQSIRLDVVKDDSTDIRFQSGNFNPVVKSLDVQDALDLTIFTSGSSLSLDSFTQNFSEVPEPASFILLGTTLIGLGWLRRRGRMDGI